MVQEKPFECLRCEARFTGAHDPKKVVERSCPRCGSNSVRLVPATRAAAESDDDDQETGRHLTG